MRRKLTHLICLVIALGLLLASSGNAADSSLIGWWKLDETSGTTAHDASNNGHNGTLKGNPTWVAGKIGGALQLDGNGDYVDIGRVGISGTSRRTIAGWAKASTTTIPSWTTVFGFAPDGNTDGTYFDVEVDDAGNYVVSIQGWEAVICPVDTQWHHFTAVYDGTGGSWYLDGRLISSEAGEIGTIDQFRIGARLSNSHYFPGLVDDIRIYNRVLTLAEIKKLVAGPKAYDPDPPDGALYKDTWASLTWLPGDGAASHNVYFGENFEDVNAGASETFRGNQTAPLFVVGFPGNPYPDGLVPGTTYYWRIDEVQADGFTTYRGDIWSFTVPSRKAYNPRPSDGAKFIDAATVTLSWTAGFGAKLHTVFFGDNFDTVNSAAAGVIYGFTTYNPGPLESGKTYYWRIDEFDAAITYRGDVWSFTTAGPGGGIRGDYYKGTDMRNHVLTRIDPQINFNWGGNAPDPAVGADQFSVRWTGEVEAAFTETYTFYTNSDDGVRLWVDREQLVDNWTDHGATENSGKIDLVAGNTYSLLMEFYENGGNAVAELRWESPRTPKQLIPQAALSPPVRATDPRPANGSAGARMASILRWTPGDYAASHEIYFGLNADAVKNADKDSPEYKGAKTRGSESYEPGKLAWDTTYYWRVDEVNNIHPDSPWKGSLWTFKTGDFLLVDDFEDYDADDNQIWYSWHDGLGYGSASTPPYFAGNGTGSAVGDETTRSFTEETIVRSGRQSMPVNYDNNKQGFAKYSEVELKLTSPRDWTEEGVAAMSLWFYGDAGNAPDRLYIAVSNSAGQPAVVIHDNPNAAQITAWTEWVIPLSAFADKGIDLKDVDKLVIGLGTRGNQTIPGGAGKMYFDDIRLYRPKTP